ncbi:MAG: lipoate--protein ligase family protein [Ignavibacteria bacterium]
MIKWEFIDSGFQTGKYNMDFDLELVERCKAVNTSFLRFYRWKPFAISLGYNQNKTFNDYNINFEKCREDGIDIVRRPTGGRAVLHSEELTYSVILKTSMSAKELYLQISSALINGLKMIDGSNDDLQKLSLTKENPDLFKLMKTGMYNFCFNSSVKYEINLNGKKLVGSAQRKFGDVFLQHGSILIGNHHKNIVNYLNIGDKNSIKKLREELDYKTICLNDILKREVTYSEVADSLLRGFETAMKISFQYYQPSNQYRQFNR